MKIVIASDKYKGSLSALRACEIIAATINELDPSVEAVINPMADGGEGTVDTLVDSLGGRKIAREVTGPLGDKVNADFGMLEDGTAVIEMASASGYVLIPEDKRNPMETTTYGTGELIARAAEMDSRKIIMGIGGSATTDGGMGMAQALGYEFLDSDGHVLGTGGKQMAKIAAIKSPELPEVNIEVACDVDNPLYGHRGAAYIYGPQKGADPAMVEELDRGLKNLSEVILRDLGTDVAHIPGAGAAGGLGAGLAAFLGAELRPGAEIVIEVTGLDDKLKGADLVVTGEGTMDEQTYYGKSPTGVAKLASKHGIPVITINGSVLSAGKKEPGLFAGSFSIINRPMTLDKAMADAEKLLHDAAAEIIGFYIDIIRKKEK